MTNLTDLEGPYRTIALCIVVLGLRDALKQIENLTHKPGDWHDEIGQIAREALEITE